MTKQQRQEILDEAVERVMHYDSGLALMAVAAARRGQVPELLMRLCVSKFCELTEVA